MKVEVDRELDVIVTPHATKYHLCQVLQSAVGAWLSVGNQPILAWNFEYM